MIPPRRDRWEKSITFMSRVPIGLSRLPVVRDGTKGPLIVEILKRSVVGRSPKRQEGYEEVLVVIRYREGASADTLLAEFARVAKAEHRIEECLQRGKRETGPADYQVPNWTGWHRHQTLCLLAPRFLVTTRHSPRKPSATWGLGPVNQVSEGCIRWISPCEVFSFSRLTRADSPLRRLGERVAVL